jgi:hypothetical protein
MLTTVGSFHLSPLLAKVGSHNFLDTVQKIVRAPRTAPVKQEEEEEEDVKMAEPNEEVESEAEQAPKPKPKRKPKKVVPVGKNGLKKKRIIKSRTTMDSKGFVGAFSSNYTHLLDMC